MADPSKPVDLKESWAAAGVNISIPKVDPKSAKALKKKMQMKALKNKPQALEGQGGTREIREEISQGKKVAAPGAEPAAALPLPVLESGATSPSGQREKRPRREDENPLSLAETNAEETERRLREEVEARLRDQGLLPFVADLEACGRVAFAGLDLFRRLAGEFPAQVAQTL